MARVVGGQLDLLEKGRNREEVADFLVHLCKRDRSLIIGLDFGFSFPAWFLDELGVTSGAELWKLASARGETWLSSHGTPFWGRRSSRRPRLPAHFRNTEEVLHARGVHPKSVFQIGGAGAVGTASIRGMPVLSRLHEAAFRVWPFSAAGLPLVIEIYPRLLTGPVVKTRETSRRLYLRERFPDLKGRFLRSAVYSEDAFDAAVSALVMYENRSGIQHLPAARDSVTRLEGWIWSPEADLTPPDNI
jgi:hypothetical protein